MRDIIVDVETTIPIKQDKATTRLVCVGAVEARPDLTWEEARKNIYFVDHTGAEFSSTSELSGLIKGNRIVGHNLTYDLGILRLNDISTEGCEYWDTMLALRCINENEPRIGLKTWATYLGLPPYWLEFEELLEKIPVNEMPADLIRDYNAYDLLATNMLFFWEKEAMRQKRIFSIEMNILPIVEKMETRGLKVDRDKVLASQRELETTITKLETKINDDYVGAGGADCLNFNSHQQVAAFLYDMLKVEEVDGRRVDEDTLKKIGHPTAQRLVDRRKLFKLKTSYVQPVLDLLTERSRVHGTVRVHGTESGRFTIRRPALQTFPGKYRHWFTPDNGMFVWGDLDQLEFKIIADVSGEAGLISQIKEGRDVHDAMAIMMFGSTDKEKRQIAKTANYGILYGAGPGTISRVGGISYNKAKEVLRLFAYELPAITRFISNVHDVVVKEGKITTPFGRVRNFMLDTDIAPRERIAGMKREAVDVIIQSMGHDLLMLLTLAIMSERPDLDLALEIHDELLFDVRPHEVGEVRDLFFSKLDKLGDLCYDVFEYRLSIPITGTVHDGLEWRK